MKRRLLQQDFDCGKASCRTKDSDKNLCGILRELKSGSERHRATTVSIRIEFGLREKMTQNLPNFFVRWLASKRAKRKNGWIHSRQSSGGRCDTSQRTLLERAREHRKDLLQEHEKDNLRLDDTCSMWCTSSLFFPLGPNNNQSKMKKDPVSTGSTIRRHSLRYKVPSFFGQNQLFLPLRAQFGHTQLHHLFFFFPLENDWPEAKQKMMKDPMTPLIDVAP
jgi:hypothetical protein